MTNPDGGHCRAPARRPSLLYRLNAWRQFAVEIALLLFIMSGVAFVIIALGWIILESIDAH